jgi:hypothetical protein
MILSQYSNCLISQLSLNLHYEAGQLNCYFTRTVFLTMWFFYNDPRWHLQFSSATYNSWRYLISCYMFRVCLATPSSSEGEWKIIIPEESFFFHLISIFNMGVLWQWKRKYWKNKGIERLFFWKKRSSIILVRDGNGPGRRVKRQSRGSARPSKSHTRPAWPIAPGLKISAHPACGPSFSGPARPVLQYSFLKSAEKRIFLSILDYEFKKT